MMRSRAKLTPAQIAANAAISSLPPPLRAPAVAATMEHTAEITLASLKPVTKAAVRRALAAIADRGMSIEAAVEIVRAASIELQLARRGLPLKRTRPGNSAAAPGRASLATRLDSQRPAERLHQKRRDTVLAAIGRGLRTGRRREGDISVAAPGEAPEFRTTVGEWYPRANGWPETMTTYRVRLPPRWLTLVKRVGLRSSRPGSGTLNDGSFVLDCLAATTSAIYGDSYIYAATIVKNTRGLSTRTKDIYVRVWPTGHETYHTRLVAAFRASEPAGVQMALQRERDEIIRREIVREDMAALEGVFG
ncbi:hypothetical protein [Hansschlegelia sp. KR7-227]|uniref:hypothetical protein n=1 Tax=Hansschlegelia sp. KR7-227 TaxID=3400914 RepID=UPI003BFF2DF5